MKKLSRTIEVVEYEKGDVLDISGLVKTTRCEEPARHENSLRESSTCVILKPFSTKNGSQSYHVLTSKLKVVILSATVLNFKENEVKYIGKLDLDTFQFETE